MTLPINPYVTATHHLTGIVVAGTVVTIDSQVHYEPIEPCEATDWRKAERVIGVQSIIEVLDGIMHHHLDASLYAWTAADERMQQHINELLTIDIPENEVHYL